MLTTGSKGRARRTAGIAGAFTLPAVSLAARESAPARGLMRKASCELGTSAMEPSSNMKHVLQGLADSWTAGSYSPANSNSTSAPTPPVSASRQGGSEVSALPLLTALPSKLKTGRTY